jgi:hypothetical protein
MFVSLLAASLSVASGVWETKTRNKRVRVLRFRYPVRDMNAEPILTKIAETFKNARLEVILVGNAAAALQGAPVTTLDFDFMFRNTPLNLKKLKKVADALGMSSSQPYYPASDLYRLIQKDTGIQLDFMSRLHGVKSFESLKSRAAEVYFGAARILVADLDDIIRSKRALGRDKDLAVLDILEKTRDEKEKAKE